ncbi:hypothetical protein [Actinocorallia herbida]|uniref:hypothetical protein n=1 Tax=Actinocorallia herbida TaxID=58109 RepID=UPI0011CE258F|nr:hypothetical protein [Actinocorallia herbida]
MVSVFAPRAALAAAVIGLCVVAPASAASAAPKGCVIGTWKQTGMSGTVIADDSYTEVHGGAGVKLTIARTSVRYDFNKSAKETTTGEVEGIHWSAWTKYTKLLSFDATVKGSASGSVRLKPKTAEGGAIGRSQVANLGPERSWKLRTTYRGGGQESIAPIKSSFTCKGKSLTLKSGFSFDGRKITVDRFFTRVP